MRPAYRSRSQKAIVFWLLAFVLSSAAGQDVREAAASRQNSLQLSRPVRPWEFLPVVGPRAALLGNEAGQFEAWAYPLKILRGLHLLFHTAGRTVPGDALARTITVRPESATIVYADNAFQVRETLFIPLSEAGAVISIEVEAAEPVEIEVAFQADLQLEWPAGLGGTFQHWDPTLRAFYLGEEQKKFVALVGSPTAALAREEYDANYSSSTESSFLLGPTGKGKDAKVVVIAASMQGAESAVSLYRQLSGNYTSLLEKSAQYYGDYLNETVRLELPDLQMQQAYDWSRISMLQGLVTNPYLGTGLVAGYRTSGVTQRPGFAWYFGRDSLWTDLALNSMGDFATPRTALDFISKYQREDGKIPHEISQSASLVDWFKGYPYPYASADATPLYIIAMRDYVAHSGDVAYAQQKWESLWKAYQFLKSTYNAQNLPQNFGIGHGWIEGGPLLPVNTELYQSGLAAQATQDLAAIAKFIGKTDISQELAQNFPKQETFLNQIFWSQEKKLYGFALDRTNQLLDTPSVLATVPMWFGLLDGDKAQAMIDVLADADHQTDWGMRIISSQNPKYDPGGYHFGSVWPLFTGWASVAEYRYHRPLPAYANLRANALLALDGSLGHVTEVLSGNYYQPLSTSSPHQIWSAAMVVSPLLRGLLGLEADAVEGRIVFAPHLPADWESLGIRNVRAGDCKVDLSLRRTLDEVDLTATPSGAGKCTLEFSPALSPRARVVGAELNGRRVPFEVPANTVDRHATVRFEPGAGANNLRIRIRNDFGLILPANLPDLGSASEGLRVVSEKWSSSHATLSLTAAGRPGQVYRLGVRNPEQIESVEGAVLEKSGPGSRGLRIQFAEDQAQGYAHRTVTIHFRNIR
jgi:glycogen debranching enzyme